MVNLKDGTVLIVYYEEGADSSIRAKRFRATRSGIEWLPPAAQNKGKERSHELQRVAAAQPQLPAISPGPNRGEDPAGAGRTDASVPSAANKQPLKYMLAGRRSRTPRSSRTCAGRPPWLPGPVRPKGSGRPPTSSCWATRGSGAAGIGTRASWPNRCFWRPPSGPRGCMVASIDQPACGRRSNS